MRFRPSLVLALACALVVSMAGTASASVRAPAKFMKPNMEKKLSKKGAKGGPSRWPPSTRSAPACRTPASRPAGCIVAPYGCTANFIFTDGSSQYVGTARHCTDKVGQEVTMQLDTTTIGVVGTVAKMTSGEGVPGNDWALIKIDPAVAAKWGVNPAMPVIGGPQGVYTGCGPTPVFHYGHGYGVAVAPGQARGRPGDQLSTTTATAGPASARPATPAAAC